MSNVGITKMETYNESKRLLRRNFVPAFLQAPILPVLFLFCGMPWYGALVFYIIFNSIIFILYSQARGREYWIKIRGDYLDKFDSRKGEIESYNLNDVKRVSVYSGGFHLYLRSGQIRHKRFNISTLENGSELVKRVKEFAKQ
jgi:hypothetical protein